MTEEVTARLRELVGERNVLTGSELADYSHDETFMDSRPAVVVRPSSTEEVAAVAALCNETRTPLTTRGGGSGLAGGPVPLAGGVVLSTERLTELRILAEDLVAVSGAGVFVADLDAAAAEQGLLYPPDPSSVAISSIGGNVACNAGGLRCLAYGVTADYVLGMTVVLADGAVLKLGGPLRKRASGYRMLSLFVGSEGTLGIITEVVLKLVPRPRHHATAMITFDTIEGAAEAARRLLNRGFLPTALELMNRPAMELVADLLPPGMKADREAALLVERDGSDADFCLMELAEMVEILDGAEDRVAQSPNERARLWEARRAYGKRVRAQRKNVFGEDVAVPVSKMPELIHRISELGKEHGLTIPAVAHIGDGNVHPAFVFDDDQRSLISPLAAQVFRYALELGGTVSAEHGLGALKRDFAFQEHGEAVVGWWHRLKDMFDPNGILNPHKLLPEAPGDDGFLDRQPGWR